MLIFTQKPSMSRLLLLFSLLHFSSFAQLTEKEVKQVVQLVGVQTAIGKNQAEYPYTYSCEGCTPDPSITIENDTNGLIYENEFLLFRHPISFKQKEEVFKLIQENYVSVFEYQQFQDYVRDSIAREIIYQNLESDLEAVKLLNISEYNGIGEVYGEYVEFDPNEREFNRAICPLNWNYHFSYSDKFLMDDLSSLYLPYYERYYKVKEFDPRKSTYRFLSIYENYGANKKAYLVDEETNTIAHTYFWANGSNSPHDRNATIGHLYPSHFKAQPIIGINGFQASAFCHWKAQEIQSKFDKNHLNYQVVVTLPSKEDLQSIQINNKTLCLPEVNLSENCKITVKEYQEFVKAVQDSILYENLFLLIEDTVKKHQLLNFKPFYFHELEQEWAKIDFRFHAQNRQYFNLKYNKKILKEFKPLVIQIENTETFIQPSYKWIENDIKSKAIIGELIEADTYYYIIDNLNYYRKGLELKNMDQVTFEPIGMDFNMNYTNSLLQNSGVRSHENYRRFFKTHVVPLTVQTTQSSDPKALMQGLTYEQAQAFYFFKNPIYKANEKSDWTNYIFPTEEQFKRIQAGETVILPQENLAFPSPVFRYVVHVFQK